MPKVSRDPQGSGRRGRKPPLKRIAAGAAGFLLVCLGVWVIFHDKDGDEVGRMQVPEGGDVKIVAVPPVTKPITPSPTPTRVIPQPKPTATVVIRPPAMQVASVTPAAAPPVMKPTGPTPPMAVAPFDTAQAKAHQEAWANHLGMQVETENSLKAKMTLIPPGEFQMGSTDEQVEAALKAAEGTKTDPTTMDFIQRTERPQHRVVITKPFLMGTTEVTVGQLKKFSAAGHETEAEKAAKTSSSPTGLTLTYLNPGYVATDDMPAAYITWNDAVAFCDWLSQQEQATYRLPTEAEWEYACRAGTTTQHAFGDDATLLDQYGWYVKNAVGKPHSSGSKLPNPFGLHEMHGNLQEWCRDYFNEKWYASSPLHDPIGPSTGAVRVVRSGFCNYPAPDCRSAAHNQYAPSHRYPTHGFRCVRELEVPPTP